MDPASPFACSDCGQRSVAGGDTCARCGNGPLLDLRQDLVRQTLREEDDRRRERTAQRGIWVGVPIGIVSMLALAFTAPAVIKAIPIPLPVAFRVIVLMCLVAWGASRLYVRLFPAERRFPDLV